MDLSRENDRTVIGAGPALTIRRYCVRDEDEGGGHTEYGFNAIGVGTVPCVCVSADPKR